MSFGVGVGDIIKIVELSRSLRRQLVDAPHQYKALASDVRNLAQLDEDIEDLLPHRDLSPEQEQKLIDRRRACETILFELQKILDGAKELDGTKQGRVRMAWKKFRWEQKDVEEFRSRLQLSMNGLTLFLQMLSGDKVFEMSKQVEQMSQREEIREKQRQAKQFLSSIPAVDYESQQQTAYDLVSANTGKWFLASKNFVDFADGALKTLLCFGMPGAGKTVIAAHTVETLKARFRNDKTVAVVPFYFSYNSRMEQTLDAVFGSLVKQLLEKSEAARDNCQKIWDTQEAENLKSEDDVKELKSSLRKLLLVFPTIIKSFSRVYFVLDGLDEYHAADSPEDPRSLTFFTQLVKLQERLGFSLFVTTRANTEIVSIFRGCTLCEIRAHDEDISTYIQNRMPELRKIQAHPDLQIEVRDTILRVADGMFLLAKLHMDTLREPITLGGFKKCLRGLPTGSEGLYKTYDQAMERINGQSVPRKELANKILCFIVHSKRGLSIIELLDALAVEPDSTDVDEEMRPDVDDIDALCAGLITLNRNTDTVRLVHKTAQDYFVTTGRLSHAHTIIAETCLTYLCYTQLLDHMVLEHASSSIIAVPKSRIYPFAVYAITFWHERLVLSDMSSVIDQALRFFRNPSRVQFCLKMMLFRLHRLHIPISTYMDITRYNVFGIHLAAAVGLHGLLPELLEPGQTIYTKDGFGITPLGYASFFDHVQTVAFILQHVSSEADFSGQQKQRENIVSVADQRRQPPTHILQSQYVAMYISIRCGHLDILRLLIACNGMESYARTELQDFSAARSQLHPLVAAARYNNTTMVNLFLQQWGSWILDASTPSGRAVLLEAMGESSKFDDALVRSVEDLNKSAADLQRERRTETISLFVDIYFADTESRYQISPLELFASAAEVESLDLMRRLLPRVKSHPDVNSSQVLHRAIEVIKNWRDTEVLNFLFKEFDIDRPNVSS